MDKCIVCGNERRENTSLCQRCFGIWSDFHYTEKRLNLQGLSSAQGLQLILLKESEIFTGSVVCNEASLWVGVTMSERKEVKKQDEPKHPDDWYIL